MKRREIRYITWILILVMFLSGCNEANDDPEIVLDTPALEEVKELTLNNEQVSKNDSLFQEYAENRKKNQCGNFQT